MSVNPIPAGYHTMTPYLNLANAKGFIAFAKKAFGAEERGLFETPDGKVMHCVLQIGDSLMMVSDAMDRPPTAASMWLYVKDCDAVFNQAVAAGAQAAMPVIDQFWGDRHGMLRDAFGVSWNIATHIEDVAPAEMERRGREAMSHRPAST